MMPHKRPLIFLLAIVLSWLPASRLLAQDLLIPMDERQSDHLKAYGAAFWTIERGQPVDWLLNYRGGAFLTASTTDLRQELAVRGVSFEVIDG
ncbi:MAG: hypothetical protein ACOCTG_02725, partial [Bacteroidota bacterium]